MTRRALLLGLVCEVLLFAWVARAEVSGSVYLISWTLLMPAVALLVAMVAGNRAVARRWHVRPLSRAEMLCIYLMVSAALPIAGFGMIRFLLPNLGNTFFLSTPENKWAEVQAHLPAWMVPRHPEQAFEGFYRGYSTPPWGDWLLPIVVWSLYIGLLVGAGLCFTLLIRRRWIEDERLTFPIATLPLEMTAPEGRFFRSPLLWIGFAIPFVLQSLLALNAMFPAVPAFQLKAKWFPLFSSLPWSAFGSIPVGYYPLSIGLAYLVPLDVSFSCWFFFLLSRFEAVLGAMAGYSQGATGSTAARFPFPEEQATGAWIALGLLLLWGARAHLRRDWRTAPGIGLIVCLAGLVAFWALAGMQIWAACLILAFYCLYLVAGMRIRAEAGGQWIFFPIIWNPNAIAVNSLGTAAFAPATLALLPIHHAFIIAPRGHPMPFHLETWKMGEQVDLKPRQMMIAFAIGLAVALPVAFATSLTEWYRSGAVVKASLYPLVKANIAYGDWRNWVNTPRTPDLPGIKAMIAGGLAVVGLTAMRAHYLWWPFHPIGYAASNTIIVRSFWLCFFIAWLVKSILLRYGGVRWYRQGLHFFLGIAFGDIMTQALWTIVGQVLGFEVYQFVT